MSANSTSRAAAGGGGLRPFIRHLRDSMADEQIEIEATVAEETDDVVRIMTTHCAKGLEFPIVALANLGTKPKFDAEPVPREEESFLHFRVGTGDGYGHFPTPGYTEVWEDEKEHHLAEKKRLLYVAATRARDHLIVPCVTGHEHADHLLGLIARALPITDRELVEIVPLQDLEPREIDTEADVEVNEPEIEAAIEQRERWIAAGEALKDAGRVEREIEIASSRERARGPLAAEVESFAATLLVGDGPPLPVGDAVHMVMERITLPDGEDLETIADDVCKEGAITEQLGDVIAMCRACLKAPSVRRAIASGRFWREVPFVLSRASEADDAKPGALVIGRVDLVYEANGELVVIDYKTDKGITKASAKQHPLDKHSGQAEAYRDGLGAATALKVREVAFVYCRAGSEVRLGDGGAITEAIT